MFRSDNNRHIRTFYPVFLGPAQQNGGDNDDEIIPVTTDQVSIIAALINPEGHDPGKETVTLINTGNTNQPLDGWMIVDKNNRSQPLSNLTLEAGETVRVKLDPSSGPQLSNKGGTIKLIYTRQQAVHTVIYSKGQARNSAGTVLF